MEQRDSNGDLRRTVAHTRYRVAELVVDVTHKLEGSMADWPSNIQDGIYKALADKSLRDRKDWQILQSYSDVDVDTGPYIHVIAVTLETLQ